MDEKTNPVKSVTIDNPEQASTNFYWTYETQSQVFNLQTTIRGTLTMEQIQAHVRSALEATAHICQLGGQAKQAGKNAYDTPALPLPVATPVDNLINQAASIPLTGVPENPVETQAPKTEELSFMTEFLECRITNEKQYFKVKGKPYSKFGVTVWPEVLAQAGIPYAKMKGETYNFLGYKATYTKNAKGSPEKITKLEKVA